MGFALWLRGSHHHVHSFQDKKIKRKRLKKNKTKRSFFSFSGGRSVVVFFGFVEGFVLEFFFCLVEGLFFKEKSG